MPNLSSLPVLDVAIGLSFVFLILSLVATAGQELLAGIFALRSKTLEKGLRNMLDKSSPAPPGSPVAAAEEKAKLAAERKAQPAAGGSAKPAAANADAEHKRAPVEKPAELASLTDELLNHPLISSLYKESRWPLGRTAMTTEPHAGDSDPKPRTGRLPSYISPRSFAIALLDTLAPQVLVTNADGTPKEDKDVIRETREAIEALGIPGGVKHRLLTILDSARGDIDAFRHGVEEWFDDSMARVSGWYKRQAQLFIILMALAVTLALNVNALSIADRLWGDPVLRGTLLAQASSATSTTEGDTAKERIDIALKNAKGVKDLGVPIGWAQADKADPRYVKWVSGADWLHNIGGWLMTILALSLGAPFWFDALGRLSRLRGSGKPESPLPATGSGKLGERVRSAGGPGSLPVNINVTTEHKPEPSPANGDASG